MNGFGSCSLGPGGIGPFQPSSNLPPFSLLTPNPYYPGFMPNALTHVTDPHYALQARPPPQENLVPSMAPNYPGLLPNALTHVPDPHYAFQARPPPQENLVPSMASNYPGLLPNALTHVPDPHYASEARPPPQENSVSTKTSTSARYLFPSPSIETNPPASAYGQSVQSFYSQYESRSYHLQYPLPSVSVQGSSVSLGGNMLHTSGFLPTAAVGGYLNGKSGGEQWEGKDLKLSTPPSNASLEKQEFGIPSIQHHLSGIEPLDESNYVKWKSQIDIVLGHLEYDVALLESKPDEPGDRASEPVKEIFRKWTKANHMCNLIIRGSLSGIIRGEIPDTDSAKELMDIIERVVIRLKNQSIGAAIRELCMMKFDGNGSVRDHIVQMEKLVCRLKDLKMEINDDFLVHMALNSLPEVYKTVKVSYYSTKQKWNVNGLIAYCVQEEVMHRHENIDSAPNETLGAKINDIQRTGSDAPTITANPGRSNKALVKQFEGTCNQCGGYGHMAFQCPTSKVVKQFEGTCNQCGGYGHMALQCLTRKNKHQPGLNQGRHQQQQSKKQRSGTDTPTAAVTTDSEKSDKTMDEKVVGSCFSCGEAGHKASKCTITTDSGKSDKTLDEKFEGSCYQCRLYGHIARNCPSKLAQVQRKKGKHQ